MLSWFSSVTIIGNLLEAPIGGLILHGATGGPSLAAFQAVYVVSGVTGMISLLMALKLLKGKERIEHGRSLKESYRKLLSGIREVASDPSSASARHSSPRPQRPWWRTSARRSTSAPPWGLSVFDIGHASGPILAGFLIARFDYIYSFWAMAALLLLAIPVFISNVAEDRPVLG